MLKDEARSYVSSKTLSPVIPSEAKNLRFLINYTSYEYKMISIPA